MRRRTLLNLILVAIAVLLSVLLWVDREPEPAPQPITALERDAITEVRVRYPKALDLHLRRGEDGWRLLSPVDERAATSEVTQILRLADAEIRREYPAEEIDDAEVGLAEPDYRVSFVAADGDRTDIELGDKGALGNERYARVGERVFLIAEPNIRALDAQFGHLLARDLLPADAEITRIELPGATLTPAGNGGWAVTPESADRGADAAQRTARAWHNARALWIKPAEDKPVQSRVRLHFDDGGKREFEVVARKPQLMLRDPRLGVRYHVAANEAGPLLDMAHGDPTAGDQANGDDD